MKKRTLSKSICSLIILMLFGLFAVPVMAETDYPVMTTGEVKAMVDQKASFTPDRCPDQPGVPGGSHCRGDQHSREKCGRMPRAAARGERHPFGNLLQRREVREKQTACQEIGTPGLPEYQNLQRGDSRVGRRNLPIVAGPDYGKKIETQKVKPADLARLIRENKGDYVLVDVRDSAGTGKVISRQPSISLRETFSTQSGVLPKEKKIIVYCNAGSRSYPRLS